MSFKASSLLGLALLGVTVAWPALPQAATETHPIHPWYSSARFQLGYGLPVPITFAPLPRGRVRPPGPAVTVQQGTTPATTTPTLPSGRSIQLAPTRMTAPGNQVVLPFYPPAFQINTSIAVYWPFASATLQAGGRTGPPTVSFCAGDVVTTNYNPACTDPGQGVINGRMVYTKTANQFGGPAPSRLEGGVEMGMRAAGTPPCHYATNPPCVVIWGNADPAPQAIGTYLGFSYSNPGPPASNPGMFNAVVHTFGTIVYMTPTGLGPGLSNPTTSFGGPWTTGRVTISVTAATPPETFTLSGSDTRVAGEGMISLVAGALRNSTLSGPNANRGWVSLYVPEPGATLGAVGALLVLMTCHRLARRRSR